MLLGKCVYKKCVVLLGECVYKKCVVLLDIFGEYKYNNGEWSEIYAKNIISSRHAKRLY